MLYLPSSSLSSGLGSHLVSHCQGKSMGFAVQSSAKFPEMQGRLPSFAFLPAHGLGMAARVWSFELWGPGSPTTRSAVTLLIYKEAKKIVNEAKQGMRQ